MKRKKKMKGKKKEMKKNEKHIKRNYVTRRDWFSPNVFGPNFM